MTDPTYDPRDFTVVMDGDRLRDLKVCAKCLETKCACDFYRQRFPKEWAERDRLGHAPLVTMPPLEPPKP